MDQQTTAPPRCPESPTTWAEEEKARLNALLPDWDIWYTPLVMNPLGRYSWSAKPSGARVSTCEAYDPSTLVEKTREYIKELPEHIEAARAELEGTDARWAELIGMRQAQLSALEILQPRVAHATASAEPETPRPAGS